MSEQRHSPTHSSTHSPTQATTHFGYETVAVEDKSARVGKVFDSVAGRYDLMNDLMSAGIHRLWKRQAVAWMGVRPGDSVLDLAGGTGDLTRLLAPLVGPKGQVILADINAEMLFLGRDRMIDCGHVGNLDYVQLDAENLPFTANSFDCICAAFGLRNVTHPGRALASMCKALKPGGRVVILEFSQPQGQLLRTFYDAYSFHVLPKMGQLITGDADSYRYLAESIRMHPDQETLKGMMAAAGLERCSYRNLSGGIVAMHRGYRL